MGLADKILEYQRRALDGERRVETLERELAKLRAGRAGAAYDALCELAIRYADQDGASFTYVYGLLRRYQLTIPIKPPVISSD